MTPPFQLALVDASLALDRQTIPRRGDTVVSVSEVGVMPGLSAARISSVVGSRS